MMYRVSIFIELQEGVLDIQGKAVERSLAGMGHDALRSVKVGKYIQVWVETGSAEDARKEAERMCDDLLVNSVIERFRIEVEGE